MGNVFYPASLKHPGVFYPYGLGGDIVVTAVPYEDGIRIEWDSTTNVVYYKIYYFEYENDGKDVHPELMHADAIEILGYYPVEVTWLDPGYTLNGNSYTHKNTPGFYGYSYVVTGVNEHGEGLTSTPAFAYTLPLPIAFNLFATPTDEGGSYDIFVNEGDAGIGYNIGTAWVNQVLLYSVSTSNPGDPGPENYDNVYDLSFNLDTNTFSFTEADIGPPIVEDGRPTLNSTAAPVKWAAYGVNITGMGPISNIITKI